MTKSYVANVIFLMIIFVLFFGNISFAQENSKQSREVAMAESVNTDDSADLMISSIIRENEMNKKKAEASTMCYIMGMKLEEMKQYKNAANYYLQSYRLDLNNQAAILAYAKLIREHNTK